MGCVCTFRNTTTTTWQNGHLCGLDPANLIFLRPPFLDVPSVPTGIDHGEKSINLGEKERTKLQKIPLRSLPCSSFIFYSPLLDWEFKLFKLGDNLQTSQGVNFDCRDVKATYVDKDSFLRCLRFIVLLFPPFPNELTKKTTCKQLPMCKHTSM